MAINLAGRIVDGQGRGINGIRVSAIPHDSETATVITLTTYNADSKAGWWSFTGLADDTWRIRIELPDKFIEFHGASSQQFNTVYVTTLYSTTTHTDLIIHTFGTLTANSATPSVASKTYWKTNNTIATTITNLTGGVSGQEVTIISTDAYTTVEKNATLKLNATFTMVSGDSLRLVYDGTSWYEVGRSFLNWYI